MFETLFTQLNYSNREAEVFLMLLEHGKASATQISKQTKIPRATVYTILDALLERGVISIERNDHKTFYQANALSSLNREIDRVKDELESKEKVVIELIKTLTPHLKKSDHSLPKLNFLEGKRSIESFMYDSLPEWRKSNAQVGDYTLWGYQDHTLVEEYRKWHDHLWKTRSPKERIYLFSNPSNVEKELLHKIPMREVRAIPEGIQFKSSIWLYGDYIFMIMSREKPHFAVHIKNDMFASNLRTIFQLLWKAKF